MAFGLWFLKFRRSTSAPSSDRVTRSRSGSVLGPDVAVEAGRRGEPLAALRTAQGHGGAAGRRRGRRRVGGALCDVSLPVGLEEGHPTEPPTALLALGPNPPPLLLHEQTGNNESVNYGGL